MKKLLLPAVVSVALIACASAPAPTSTAEGSPAAQSAKKTSRVVITRVPVEKKASVRFADGSLDEYTVSEYNQALTLVTVQSKFSASGAPVERVEYSYRGDVLATKTTKDGQGLVTSRRTYTYDAAGHLTLEALEDGAGKPISSFEYGYDAAGHRSKWIVKDAKGTPVAETVYSYANGKVRSAELRDGSGKKTGSSAYEYDGEGRLTAQRFYDSFGSLLRVETTVWKDGRPLKEERTSPGGVVQQRSTYEYGPAGELVRKTVEDSVGKSKQIVEYEYSFREDRRTVEE